MTRRSLFKRALSVMAGSVLASTPLAGRWFKDEEESEQPLMFNGVPVVMSESFDDNWDAVVFVPLSEIMFPFDKPVPTLRGVRKFFLETFTKPRSEYEKLVDLDNGTDNPAG